MFKQTLFNGLTNVVPFWSSSLMQILGLGVEYNIVLNMLFNELVRQSTDHLSDEWLSALIMVAFAAVAYYKFGGTTSCNWFQKNVVVVTGKEVVGNLETTLIYCDKIAAINAYLLKHCAFRSVTYVDDLKFTLNDVSQFPLTKNIYISISRTSLASAGSSVVHYRMWSYQDDVQGFLEKLVSEHKSSSISEITLIGDEENKKIAYPVPMHAINQHVLLHYEDFPRYLCMMRSTNLNTGAAATENAEGKNAGKDTTSTASTVVDKIKNKLKTAGDDYSYTLDDVCNYKLGDVFITIHRENNMVFYTLKSNVVHCRDWLEQVVQQYRQTRNNKFKCNMRLTGAEEMHFSESCMKMYQYTKEMWAINWLLIEKQKYQNFERVNGTTSTRYNVCTPYEYVLEPMELYKIEEDVFLTVEKEEVRKHWEPSARKINNSCNILYLLQSNQVDLKAKLQSYVEQYDAYNEHKWENLILYHFTYCGMKDGKLTFNARVLSEENTERELFETFDKLHNENVEPLRKDLDKLKDLEYFKKHGLKRKKGYLFHGKPGCGKTSAVVAMALYDKRHIVEIPFSLLTEHDEFERIMHLDEINKNVSISHNNVILLFDEIDIGMEKVGNRLATASPEEEASNPKNLAAAATAADFELVGTAAVNSVIKSFISEPDTKGSNTLNQKINLATLLSRLDGIGNYNGLVIVGTTNCLHKLDPALYRELRLTPMEFRELRAMDCIAIIQSYFGDQYDANKWHPLIRERVLTPVKLISLCLTHESTMSADEFFQNILMDVMK